MTAGICGLIGVPCQYWQYMDAGIWDCVMPHFCPRLVPERVIGEDLDPMNQQIWRRSTQEAD